MPLSYCAEHAVSTFQGKRINPSFVNPAIGNPFKPGSTGKHQLYRVKSRAVSADRFSGPPRQSHNTAALLANGPTNAHGGINFNRVRPNQRLAAQYVGLGWPAAGGRGSTGGHAMERHPGATGGYSSAEGECSSLGQVITTV